MTAALNFDTPDCRISGGCDLYTTKAAGPDKKLYKSIDKSLETQHAAALKFGASLSPPQREEMAASLNLSRSSPFGPLSEMQSRRTYAYLIATLNASHPDYDFSHVLRPTDFKREKSLRRVMSNFDATLHTMRPHASSIGSLPRSLGGSGSPADSAVAGGSASGNLGSGGHGRGSAARSGHGGAGAGAARSHTSAGGGAIAALSEQVWGAHSWSLIDREMTLAECATYTYQPAEDPFADEAEEDGDDEGGGAAVWSLHHLFFSKKRKRVAYLYVRAVPLLSRSPRTVAMGPGIMGVGMGIGTLRLGAPADVDGDATGFPVVPPLRKSSSSLSKRSAAGLWDDDSDSDDALGVSAGHGGRWRSGLGTARKRARYWLGDRVASRVIEVEEDEEGEFGVGSGYVAADAFEEETQEEDEEDEEDEDDDDDDHEHERVRTSRSPVRGVSEDIAARMDL